MRLLRLTVRGVRNLVDATLEFPAEGLALLGANGQGKTSLLEAMAFPVLFRSFRGATDQQITRFGEAGFHVGLDFEAGGRARTVAFTARLAGRRREYQLDGTSLPRARDGAGAWLAVVFAPEDVALASGAGASRRLYLDRTLALADAGYLRALGRYRRALTQRNAALRQDRRDLAQAFDGPLAASGAVVVAGRLAWVAAVAERFGETVAALGETGGAATLAYAGHAELVDPAAWPELLARHAARDQSSGGTTVGPHRDDLSLMLAGRPLREFGSTGQRRGAAVALKLLELETLERARGATPALLLDDVFAELDRERQDRLADRLLGTRRAQTFITAPRGDELPGTLRLTGRRVAGGRVSD